MPARHARAKWMAFWISPKNLVVQKQLMNACPSICLSVTHANLLNLSFVYSYVCMNIGLQLLFLGCLCRFAGYIKKSSKSSKTGFSRSRSLSQSANKISIHFVLSLSLWWYRSLSLPPSLPPTLPLPHIPALIHVPFPQTHAHEKKRVLFSSALSPIIVSLFVSFQ